MDDAMIALYQNGEPIRPEQGFPMRLLLPGFEGNTNVKWVRKIKVTDSPTFTRDETSRYTELMPDGKARQFMLQMEPKSVILKPSFGMNMQGPAIMKSPDSPGPAWGRVRASIFPPMAARPGRKPLCQVRCCRKQRRDSVCRGCGTVSPSR
jgi:sulfane dehydrogenase subunit SoxC